MNTVVINLYSPSYDCQLMERLCGRYDHQVEVKQVCEYSIENGLATITSIKPVYSTQVRLPLPFTVPVNDLGSGFLNRIDLDVDTMIPRTSVCPDLRWHQNRMKSTVPNPVQELMGDWASLI